MGLRLFAAVVPPPHALEHLEEFLAVRREAGDFRWTATEQLHVTCAFMASVDEWRVEEYVDRLESGLAGLPVPVVRLSGPVAFPNAARARVLAVDVLPETEGGDDVLRRIAGKARSAAVSCGIEVDGQRFRPHVTVARMRQPTEVTNGVRVLQTYVGPEWPVTEVEVVSSHLGEGPRKRPRYETLARVPVGS